MTTPQAILTGFALVALAIAPVLSYAEENIKVCEVSVTKKNLEATVSHCNKGDTILFVAKLSFTQQVNELVARACIPESVLAPFPYIQWKGVYRITCEYRGSLLEIKRLTDK